MKAGTSQPSAEVMRRVSVGAIIGSKLRLEQKDAAATAGLGTLSLFALVNGIRDRRVVVLVGNRHVLFANGAAIGDAVFAPPVAVDGTGVRAALAGEEAVARLSHAGLEGNYAFAYPGDAATEYFVDAAAAELLPGVVAETRAWPASARVPDGTRVRGIGRLHRLDASGTRRPRVRRLGGPSAMATGRVVNAAATVLDARGQERRNVIAVQADDGALIEPGGSGALLVDERDRAVGVVWGRDERDASLAYACHIHPLLDCLGVTPLVGGFA
jgi:hypothetical protein